MADTELSREKPESSRELDWRSASLEINEKFRIEAIANLIVAPGKGILAADESLPTIEKRFSKLGLPSNDFTRNSYRETLFSTPGFEEVISGVILFKEQLEAEGYGAKALRSYLQEAGIIIGIKVDEGLKDFNEVEKISKPSGLEGLAERLQTYRKLGADFTKWRAALVIEGEAYPSKECIEENASLLAQYARASQEAGLTPIVEPEVLMDGNHTIERCYEVTKLTLEIVFEELKKAGVYLPGMILKPNMVISGKECEVHASADKVAEMTLLCLEETLPIEVPGVTFLSGGQRTEQAIENLNAINSYRIKTREKDPERFPWQPSFSYGRGLQDEAMKAFAGGVLEAQKVFLKRAIEAGAAAQGVFSD